MPSVEKISVALPPEMLSEVREAVEAGEYASSSEVVRDALSDWTRKRHQQQNGLDGLREAWQQGRAEDTSGASVDEVLDRLEQKYRGLADDDAAAQ